MNLKSSKFAKFGVLVLLVAMTFTLAACSDDDDGGSSAKVSSIIDNGTTISAIVGTPKDDVLPTQAGVVLDNGDEAEAPVNWGDESTPPYDKDTAGDYTFQGQLDTSNKPFTSDDSLTAEITIKLEEQIEPTYDITVADNANVTVTTTPSAEAEEGEEVTVTIDNIEAGYQFDSLTVTDADGNVETTEVTAGEEYTFTMPAQAVDVEVATVEDPGYVGNATELQDAVTNTDVDKITLESNITADVNATRLVDIDFADYTLTGNVDYTTDETGSLVLEGTASPSIDGDLTIDAGNADVTNNVEVSGAVDIINVAANTYTEAGDNGNTIIINDEDGATVNIDGNTGTVTVNTPNNNVNVGEGKTVNNVTVGENATGTTVTNNGTVDNAEVNNNESAVEGNKPDKVEGNYDAYVAEFSSITVAESSDGDVKAQAAADVTINYEIYDQYGKDITGDLGTNSVEANITINGMNVDYVDGDSDLAAGTVVINGSDLIDGELVALELVGKNADDDKTATANFEYSFSDDPVATTIKEITTDDSNVEAGEVEVSTNDITLSAKVLDQYGSEFDNFGEPAEDNNKAKLRWQINSGQGDVIEFSDNNDNVNTDSNSGDGNDLTAINENGTVDINAVGVGTAEVTVFIKSSGTEVEQTFNLTVTAKELTDLDVDTAEQPTNLYNNEEFIAFEVLPVDADTNDTRDAVLTKDQMSVEVVNADSGDISNLELVEDPTVNDTDLEGIFVKVTTAVAGEYDIKVTHTKEDTDNLTVTETVTTEINPNPTTIEVIEDQTVKQDNTIEVPVVVRNTHGELLSYDQLTTGTDNTPQSVFYNEQDTKVADLSVYEPATEDKDTQSFYLEINPTTSETAGTGYYTIVGLKNKAFTKEFGVEVLEKAALDSIDLGTDITDESVIANDDTTVYHPITLTDNYGDTMVDTSSIGAVSVEDSNEDPVTLSTSEVNYYKYNDEDKMVDSNKENAEGVALKLNANNQSYTEAKTLTVTVDNGLASDNKDYISDTLDVVVNPQRKIKSLEFSPENLEVGLGAQETLTIKTLDQYGEFFAVGADTSDVTEITVSSANVDIADSVSNVVSYNEDGNADSTPADVVEYRIDVEGKAVDTTDLTVEADDSGNTVTDTVGVDVISTSDLINNIEFTGDDVEAGEYNYKVKADKSDLKVDLTGYDSNGDKVSFNEADVLFTTDNDVMTSSSISIDASREVNLDATAGTTLNDEISSETVVTVTADIYGKKATLEVPYVPSDTADSYSNMRLTSGSEDKLTNGTLVVDKDMNDSSITLDLESFDQFGNWDSATLDKVTSTRTDLATASVSSNTVTITPKNTGTLTVTAYIQDQSYEIDVEVKEEYFTAQNSSELEHLINNIEPRASIVLGQDISLASNTTLNNSDNGVKIDLNNNKLDASASETLTLDGTSKATVINGKLDLAVTVSKDAAMEDINFASSSKTITVESSQELTLKGDIENSGSLTWTINGTVDTTEATLDSDLAASKGVTSITINSSNNDVDNDIVFDLTATADWMKQVNEVKINSSSISETTVNDTNWSVDVANSTLTIDQGVIENAEDLKLTVKSNNYASYSESSLTVVHGVASQLAVTTEPVASRSTTDANFDTKPEITIQDQYGNTVTSASDETITASIKNGGDGTATLDSLSDAQTTATDCSSGVVSYSSLSGTLSQNADASNVVLTFTLDSDNSITVDSSQFSITN